jgi:hypothetical protein
MAPITVPKPTIEPDSGLYRDAAAASMETTAYLAQLCPAPPEFVAEAEASFYRDRGLDPARYAHQGPQGPVHQWAEGKAALSAMLNWYEQKHSHKLVTVQDFYHTDTGVTSLFPAWIESEIQAALISSGIVSQLIFGTESVDSSKVTALYDSTSPGERSLRRVAEGAALPEAKLTLADSSIVLGKYGRSIEASYEVIASQKLDALADHFRKIMLQVAVDETDAALDVLVGGDGTTMGAAESNSTDYDVNSAGTVAYSDLIGWVLGMDAPYTMDKAVFGDTDLALIQNLSEFKTDSFSGAGSKFLAPSPKSLTYLRWEGGVTGSSYVDRLGIGIDSRYALKKYTWGGSLQEQDKIISRQVNLWTYSQWVGFRKWDTSAVYVLDCNAAL